MITFSGTTTMLEAFGYDNLGNAPHLLAEADRSVMESGHAQRAGGAAICEICGCELRIHPVVQGALWLHRICDGRLVHL